VATPPRSPVTSRVISGVSVGVNRSPVRPLPAGLSIPPAPRPLASSGGPAGGRHSPVLAPTPVLPRDSVVNAVGDGTVRRILRAGVGLDSVTGCSGSAPDVSRPTGRSLPRGRSAWLVRCSPLSRGSPGGRVTPSGRLPPVVLLVSACVLPPASAAVSARGWSTRDGVDTPVGPTPNRWTVRPGGVGPRPGARPAGDPPRSVGATPVSTVSAASPLSRGSCGRGAPLASSVAARPSASRSIRVPASPAASRPPTSCSSCVPAPSEVPRPALLCSPLVATRSRSVSVTSVQSLRSSAGGVRPLRVPTRLSAVACRWRAKTG
jgi:hypothetical protein